MTQTDTIPRSDVDLFSAEVMADPYPLYRQLRDAGPVVYLDRFDVWAVTRYAEARHVLADWQSFSSADIALNEQFNSYVGDGIIRSNPPLHDQQRDVLASRLSPRAVREIQPEIDARATDVVAALVERGSFDAVSDLARPFPLEVVADLIGLPRQGRERLLELVDANFNCFGPDNDRTRESGPKLAELAQYVMANATKETLAENSMGAAVYEAVDAGWVPADAAPWLVMTYVTAGIDTTVHAVGHMIWLFAQHRDQWEELRAEPALIPGAFREVLRYESPVQLFGRTATNEWTVGDVTVPAGSRLAVLFGCANRDERKWEQADRFDVRRNNIDQLAFGYGLHACAGQALARIEGEAILRALINTVSDIEAGDAVRHYNNVLRGLESLPVKVIKAQ
ncbi:cytochrome P450 [Mycobacterium sp. 663a-19]|uniref:cytochrome P450 n=1 Tax=Mycobacterium sp. 663a-19 TaxID=2986148 RepID=UPI002D1F7205|nr:cytochrome P450 [Mycobacterium sp. 663a-19]MEB3980138.1 cytochrome P450 [Mycobacterium sp. 663a-19]